MPGEKAPSNTVRSSISFETVKREKLFRNPPTDKSAYPALIAAVQPHVDSFNAMTEAGGLLEHARRDIGEKIVFDGKADSGSLGNKISRRCFLALHEVRPADRR